ncbi:MAG: 2OG-Fe(II) oxygenase [Verrucomicrobia bacterium]|nr:2OG-Fe(II) oxygenase [Verrucomicrobiota bacterium]
MDSPDSKTSVVNDAVTEAMIRAAVAKLDWPRLEHEYWEQDEFLYLNNFLPPEVLRVWEQELTTLRPRIHRNYIPGHKKGGSVGYDTMRVLAPAMDAVYRSQSFIQFLQKLVRAEIKECPESDPHRCALYAYTEQGDHIGFHYDTSYYKDRRYTVLFGLRDDSNSRLVCRLHTRNANRETEWMAVKLAPGTLVLFNGDKVYHAVTPLQKGEERFVLTLQYVTSEEMHWFWRFVSNMKDSIAYFGFRQVFFNRDPKV